MKLSAGENYQVIGIDKIVFYNIQIPNIDIPYLSSHDKVEIQLMAPGMWSRWRTPDGNGVRKILIKDNNVFSDFVIGFADLKDGRCCEYEYLTLIVHGADGSNLAPWSYTQYNSHIKKVIDYLASEYRIEVNTDDMKVRYMEINSNIPLTQSFDKYDRPLKLLMSFLPRMTKQSIFEAEKCGKKYVESFYRGNDSVEVVMYDKLRELSKMGKKHDGPETAILRIEFRLKTQQKINQEFKSNLWRDLNDNLIISFYISQMNKWETAYYKWKGQRKKDLIKMLKKYYKEMPSTWPNKVKR